MERCLHCTEPTKVPKRGLCLFCWTDEAVRRLYPRRYSKDEQQGDDTSAADLERMIAEQLPTMPDGKRLRRSLERMEHGNRVKVQVIRSPHRRGPGAREVTG